MKILKALNFRTIDLSILDWLPHVSLRLNKLSFIAQSSAEP